MIFNHSNVFNSQPPIYSHVCMQSLSKHFHTQAPILCLSTHINPNTLRYCKIEKDFYSLYISICTPIQRQFHTSYHHVSLLCFSFQVLLNDNLKHCDAEGTSPMSCWQTARRSKTEDEGTLNVVQHRKTPIHVNMSFTESMQKLTYKECLQRL